MDNNSKNAEQTAESEAAEKLCQKINPFLEHLEVEGADIDKDKIRKHFVSMWEYENGDSLEGEELYMTIIALFIYCTHLALDECNVNVKRARGCIAEALRAEMAPELEKQTAAEKESGNPFKSFVDNQSAKVDDVYTWRHFLLDHTKKDDNAWTYRMGKCWFHSFFVRFGRPDFIETACEFDRIPAEARKDYVDLKLQNSFSKLGKYCQFTYTPKKS